MGRKIKLYTYDSDASTSQGVRDIQRAVNQHHIVALIGPWSSEVTLAVMPWAERYHVPIFSSGSTDKLAKKVRTQYSRYKYSFMFSLNTRSQGETVCQFTHDVLVNKEHIKRVAVLSEEAAWTKPLVTIYPRCLKKAGVKVVDYVQFPRSLNDFTPIFNKMMEHKPQVIITALAYDATRPVIQWQQMEVSAAMAGINAQASSAGFWDHTNGAADGVISTEATAPGMSPKTEPFMKQYKKEYGSLPVYTGYTTTDTIHALVNAIKRVGNVKDSAKLVSQLEKMDYEGTLGRDIFYSKNQVGAHSLKRGKKFVIWPIFQWQKDHQVVLWPNKVAKGSVSLH